MSLITLKNVNMQFNIKLKKSKKATITALSNTSLEINEGEILAVVGESGCGKTTLGKLITGIYKPTSGNVLYQDQDIHKLRGSHYKNYRLSVQMMHQDSYAALNPSKTIAQSLVLPLLRHKIAKTRQEAIEVLFNYFNEVGLNPPEIFLEKYPHQLSGGQRQRILLARVLSVNPKLIVADEPVSMVDVSIRISLLNLMAKMNKKYRISFVYITHDLGTARYIAANGKIAIMYLGQIIEKNNIDSAIEHPLHPYFSALLAAVPEANPERRSSYASELPLRSLDLPNLLELPKACKFHPRCLYCIEKCMQEEPMLVEYNGGEVACHRREEIQFLKNTMILN